jgi:hypothetical protein
MCAAWPKCVIKKEERNKTDSVSFFLSHSLSFYLSVEEIENVFYFFYKIHVDRKPLRSFMSVIL